MKVKGPTGEHAETGEDREQTEQMRDLGTAPGVDMARRPGFRRLGRPLSRRRGCGHAGVRASGDLRQQREQRGFVEWLRKVIVHPGRQAALAVAGHGVRGHRYDRSLAAADDFRLADVAGGFETVHLRHLHVHQDQVEGFVAGGGDRLATVPGVEHGVAALLEEGRGEGAVDHIVLGEQDAQADGGNRFASLGIRSGGFPSCRRVLGGTCGRRQAGRRHYPEPGGKVKGRSFAGSAFDPDPPAHPFNQLRGNGQSQPGAAVVPRGRTVHLGKRLEDHRLLFRWNADPRVRDRKVQAALADPIRLGRHLQDDRAAFRELQGVVDEVEEDLSQPQRIAEVAFRHARRELGSQLEVFLPRADDQRLEQLGDRFGEREIDRLEFQFSGFDFREIEDVVD